MTDAWIIAMWLSMPIATLMGYYLIEFGFWCFCACFCKVDDHFQQIHWRKISAAKDNRKTFNYKKAV